MSNRRSIKSIRMTYHVSLLPAWLLNDYKADPDCILTDISHGGAAVLVPKSLASASELFNLVFMSPNVEGEVLATLQATQCWRDENHSDSYIKIGLSFRSISPIELQVINALIEILGQNKIPQSLMHH